MQCLVFFFLMMTTAATAKPVLQPADSSRHGSVINICALSLRPFYHETTTFSGQNEFVHSLSYNDPKVIDEEHTFTLGMNFAPTEKLKAGNVYDVAKDTTVLHCTFGNLSVWTWDYDTHPVFTGTVRIVKAEEDTIVLEENIRIVRPDGQVVVYKGKRTFRRKEED